MVVFFEAVEDLTNNGFFYIELKFNPTERLSYVKWGSSFLELSRVLQVVNLGWKIEIPGINVDLEADFVSVTQGRSHRSIVRALKSLTKAKTAQVSDSSICIVICGHDICEVIDDLTTLGDHFGE